MFHDGEVFFTPAYPLEKVVDPTGPGDTFAKGLWVISQRAVRGRERCRGTT